MHNQKLTYDELEEQLYQLYGQLDEREAEIGKLHNEIQSGASSTRREQPILDKQEELDTYKGGQNNRKREESRNHERMVQLIAESEANKENVSELKDRETKLQNQLAGVQSTIVNLRSQLKKESDRADEAEQRRGRESQAQKLLELENEKLFYTIADLEARENQCAQELSQLITENEALERENKELQNNLLQTSTSIKMDEENKGTLKKRIAELESLVKETKELSEERQRQHRFELECEKTNANAADERHREARSQIAQLSAELDKIKSSSYQAKLESEVKLLQNKIVQLETDCSELLAENDRSDEKLCALKSQMEEAGSQHKEHLIEAESRERLKLIRLQQAYHTLEKLQSTSQLRIHDLTEHNLTIQEKLNNAEERIRYYEDSHGGSHSLSRERRLESDLLRREQDLKHVSALLSKEHDKMQELQIGYNQRSCSAGGGEDRETLNRMASTLDHLKFFCHNIQQQQSSLKSMLLEDSSVTIAQASWRHKDIGVQFTSDEVELKNLHEDTGKKKSDNEMHHTKVIQCSYTQTEPGRPETKDVSIQVKRGKFVRPSTRDVCIQAQRDNEQLRQIYAKLKAADKAQKEEQKKIEMDKKYQEAFDSASRKLNALHRLVAAAKDGKAQKEIEQE